MNNTIKTPCMAVSHLKKYYPFKGGNVLKALDDVTLNVEKGEIFGIVGESGCGKSTLGKCMMRLVNITEGNIIFNGKDISMQKRIDILSELREIQMIFQNPYSSFNPKLKIGYSLNEACRLRGFTKDRIVEMTAKFLDYISLSENELNRFPHELSGGQLQRLAIARALMLNPSFIVADEPVSALDVSVQAQILNLLLDLRNKLDMTMLFISHDMTVVEHLCNKTAVLYLGSVIEKGDTDVLFANMLHPYTQALMSAIPVIDADDEHEYMHRIILTGDIPTAVNIPSGCRFAPRCRHSMKICKEISPKLKEVEPNHVVACHLFY